MDLPASPFASPAGPTMRRRPLAEVPDDARPYAVRMRDGVRLATDVYLPARGRRWPVLLSRLPYDKAGDECFMPQIARWFTQRGYAVVVQDVRGKVRSGGALAPFVTEIADGYDTLEWITQQRWCQGAVGMFGDSYFGWTQWAAAASQHPALAAITPRVISADITDLTGRQGVFALEVNALWAMETWVDDALYDFPEPPDWSLRPLSEIVPAALGGMRPTYLERAVGGALPDACRLPVLGDVPTLHVGAWWDFLQRGQIATWRRARAGGGAPQFLIMDAADHGWNRFRAPDEAYVDPRTDDTTMNRFLDDYLGMLLPFLDRYVAGQDAPVAPPVRWVLANESWRADQSWRASEEWPPVGSRPVDWFLAGDPLRHSGVLTRGRDTQERVVAWTHDPHCPVPSLGHAYHPLIEPADEAAHDHRDDVLVFRTSTTRRPLDLVGPAALTAAITSDADSAHLMAVVSDVAPDGHARRILSGAAYAGGPWPGEVAIDLGSTGYRLQPGHQLRVSLSSSEFPRYALHPGTRADPWTAVSFRSAEQQIILGGRRAARLRMCVLPSDEGTE